MKNGFEEGKKESGRMNFGSYCSGLEGADSGSSQGNRSWEKVHKWNI